MWTQLHSIRSDGAARGCRSRAGLATYAAIVSCALGLMVPAQTASSQTLDGSVSAVQPNAVQAAKRHQARPTDNDASVDAAVVQHPHQKPAAEKAHNSPRSKPMNRTARAYLESNRQATGLPPTAMVCQDCEPEPSCSVWAPPCHPNRNSPTIDGAAIVVQR